MTQIKYITDDIDELDAAEQDLEANGIPRSHIHVLSEDTEALQAHDLPAFSEWAKRDITHYGLRGGAFGLAFCTVIVAIALTLGVSDSIGWAVVSFIAALVMGFCTWEGGLMGVSKLNHRFTQYSDALAEGKHLLVVDVHSETEEQRARYSIDSHPVLHAVS